MTLVWTENRATNEWTAGEFRIIWTWTNATKLYRNGKLLKTVRPGSVKVLMEYANGLDWIEHDGKAPPTLPEGTKVVVRYMDGFESGLPAPTDYWGTSDPSTESNWVWPETGPNEMFITHYRIVTPAQP